MYLLKISPTETQPIKSANLNKNLFQLSPVNFGAEILESGVKNQLKFHLHKVKIDRVCYISIKDIKEEINEYIKNMEENIYSCILCKKKYKFSSIDIHSCYKK